MNSVGKRYASEKLVPIALCFIPESMNPAPRDIIGRAGVLHYVIPARSYT
jgi:hypothetical protein